MGTIKRAAWAVFILPAAMLAFGLAAGRPVQGRGLAVEPPVCTLSAKAGCPDFVDGRVRWLRTQQVAGQLGPDLTQAVPLTVRFDHALSAGELHDLERQGMIPSRQIGDLQNDQRAVARLLRKTAIVPLTVPWNKFDTLLARRDVQQIDADTSEGLLPPLDLTVPEMHAAAAWVVSSTLPAGLNGAGVTVADIDTGVDVFHPLLFLADGGTFAWLDTNANAVFDPGVDAVDLNGNGLADPGERLRFVDGTSLQFDGFPRPYDVPGTNDGVFSTDMDWLYNDANGNGRRDFGAGYSDTTPSLGERVFLVQDANGNQRLDPGETLSGLGTSKIAAVLDTNGITRRRGIDLSQTALDPYTHGSAVLSIVAGGWRGVSRYTGLAPAADLLLADPYGSGNSTTDSLLWSLNNGAQIVIHEYTHIALEYFDGSSNLEALIAEAHRQGVAQVLPAGNINRGRKHAALTLAPGSAGLLPLVQPAGVDATSVDMTLVWHGAANAVPAVLTTPAGGSTNQYVVPPANGATTTADGHTIWSTRSQSSRGTGRIDLHVTRSPLATGTFSLVISNTTASSLTLSAFTQDNRSSWVGGLEWGAYRDPAFSVIWPATADDGIVVGSYSTRGFDVGLDPVTPGGLSAFSGQGPRIDGRPLLDISAPSNYDVVAALDRAQTGTWGQYRWFSGTSGAAPHVGGALALLRQARPDLDALDLESALRDGARGDSFTGSQPNEAWGTGKIDVAGSLRRLLPFAPQRAARLAGPQPNPDGTLQPGEWDAARRVRVPLAFLTDEPQHGFLDLWLVASPQAGDRLFVAAQVSGVAQTAGDGLWLWFDNGDVKSLQVGAGWQDWHWDGSSLQLDAQQNGRGAVSLDDGVTTFEIGMPLFDGDPDDVALSTTHDSGFAVAFSQPFSDSFGSARHAVGAWPADFFDGRLDKLGRLAVDPAWAGDLNADGVSDVVDVQLLAARWAVDSRQAAYDAVFDLNNDGAIDTLDVQQIAGLWSR